MQLTEELNSPGVHWRQLTDALDSDSAMWLCEAHAACHRIYDGRYLKPAGSLTPYCVHPFRVAAILAAEWRRFDRRTVLTALFHDALKFDREKSEQEILTVAGKEVLDAVCTLTKPVLPASATEDARASRNAQYFGELRQAPEWVRIVKCADRLDNLREACRYADAPFWNRFRSETIGWHLVLARETSPVAELALFGALVAGDRSIQGRVPVWLDGHLVDPHAAACLPEHLARHLGVVGIALRGETLLIGAAEPAERSVIDLLASVTERRIEVVRVTADAIADALSAGMYAGHAVVATIECAVGTGLRTVETL